MADRLSSRGLIAALCIVAVTACSGVDPLLDEEYQSARRQIDAARSDPLVSEHAAIPLNDARDTLRQASEARDVGELRHLAYLARKKVEIARAVAQARDAEIRVRAANSELVEARKKRALLTATRQTAESTPLAEPAAGSTGNDPQDKTPEEEQSAQIPDEETERVDAAAAKAVAAAIAHAETVAVLSLAARMPGFSLRDDPQGIVITLPATSFPTGETSLDENITARLEPLIQYLKDNPTRMVVVKGYTDDTGAASYNMRVSNRRAEAVKDTLVEKGVEESRILTIGYGENQPVASNDTRDGRSANRRVEIVLVGPGDGAAPTGEQAMRPSPGPAPQATTR